MILHDAEGFTEISNLSKCLQTQCLSGVEGVLNFGKCERKSACKVYVQIKIDENKTFFGYILPIEII